MIEVAYFMFWICSLAIFLMFANCVKYKSIQKKEADDEYMRNNQHRTDIWGSKNSDDFLRYLKWEAFTVGFYLTQLFMNLYIIRVNPIDHPTATKLVVALGVMIAYRAF